VSTTWTPRSNSVVGHAGDGVAPSLVGEQGFFVGRNGPLVTPPQMAVRWRLGLLTRDPQDGLDGLHRARAKQTAVPLETAL